MRLLYLSWLSLLMYCRSRRLFPTIINSPRRLWKSFGCDRRCSVNWLIRSVSIATCTSGEPVSLPCVRCASITSCLRSCKSICLLSFLFIDCILVSVNNITFEPLGLLWQTNHHCLCRIVALKSHQSETFFLNDSRPGRRLSNRCSLRAFLNSGMPTAT